MNIVTIKEVKGVVRCADDGTAEHVFNVKNATNKALQVGMLLSMNEPTRKEWLKIDGPAELDLDVETMTQVSVKIQAPSDCAPGKYAYRLRVFDPNSPGENFSDGDAVYFEVPEKKEKVIKKEENVKKPFNWWIPLAIVVGVIVIGGIIWLAWPSGVKMPDFTQEEWNKVKAVEFLNKNDLHYTTRLQLDPNPGSEQEILEQEPAPDTKLEKEVQVILKIAGVRVPRVKDLSFSEALQQISSEGLSFSDKTDLRITAVSRADQHEKVLEQNPRKFKLVAKKSAVVLTVGRLADKKFGLIQLPQVPLMKGIHMSSGFLKREVEPESE